MNIGPGDTSLGGERRGFPETSWEFIQSLKETSPGPYRDAIEDLCRRYWKPVYRFIRLTRVKSNEDAKDLTQAFFLWLLEGDGLRNYAPERAGFRTYLKLLLTRFVGQQDRSEKRLKRGGGVKLLDLDAALVEPEDPPGTDPGAAFDLAWRCEIVRHAVDCVRHRLEGDSRRLQFEIFEAYVMPAGSRCTYAQLAERSGLQESDVRKILWRVRNEVREEVRREISALSHDQAEFEEEWNDFLGT